MKFICSLAKLKAQARSQQQSADQVTLEDTATKL